MRNLEADTLPIYKNGYQIGEASCAELVEFVGDKDDPLNVYYHKVNFDLWTAVTLIREKKEKQNEKLRRERERIKILLKKRAMSFTLGIVLFVLLLAGANMFYKGGTSFPVYSKNQSDKSVQKTVTTGKGKIRKIVLSDGTKVWLNAESSIRFPEKFNPDGPRKVFLNGEGYFEVPKMKSGQSFIVETDKQYVEVLGTHFDVNAYSDEIGEKTTLLEGSVKVTPSGGESIGVVLKPNQMTTLADTHIEVQNIDTDMVTSWKRGEFIFRNEPLENIMRVLVRWYNLEVSYENDEIRNLTLGGSISRSEQIPAVLKMLELTGDVHFTIEGRRVVIK